MLYWGFFLVLGSFKVIYLDWNAAAPLAPVAKAALDRLFSLDSTAFHPLSPHCQGRLAKHLLEEARDHIKQAFLSTHNLLFLSSATEANQLVIRSSFASAQPPFIWALSPLEHDSVLSMVPWVESQGGRVRFLDVLPDGRLDVNSLSRIDEQVSLVTHLYGHNELGCVSDMAALLARCRAVGTKLHVDASQAAGKLPLDLSQWDFDWVVLSAYKMGGLSGVGGLFFHPSLTISPQILGAHESGLRAGGYNMAGIISFGAVAKTLFSYPLAQLLELQSRFEKLLFATIPGIEIVGWGTPDRLCQTTHLTLPSHHFAQNELLVRLDMLGFCVSQGSACQSGLSFSHVLAQLGYSAQKAYASVRVSYGPSTSWLELESLAEALQAIYRKER